MKHLIKSITLLSFVICHLSIVTAYGQSPVKPYDENQDVRADLKKATTLAEKENKHVLVQMGGNWCPWCIRFHKMAGEAQPIDSLLKADYVYVLANVPQDKKKRDYQLFRDYGYPNRFGYPVFLILDGQGKLLHIQDSGILEHCVAKGYDTTKVVTFLKMWNVKAIDPDTYQVPKSLH
ncbi:MAG: thioredoxin family protein [Bacteroidales bacterium]|nr:thioredoxin family protein [Bacteroidales bacterium]